MKQFAAILLLFGLFAPASLVADDSIWSALVLARNVENPGSPPEKLKPFTGKLSRIFGYNEFKIIGETSRKIDSSDGEQWLLPSKHLFLRVEASGLKVDGYRLELALFRDKKLLVKTTARLGVQSPLFIRGPLYGDGQLIIVLLVK